MNRSEHVREVGEGVVFPGLLLMVFGLGRVWDGGPWSTAITGATMLLSSAIIRWWLGPSRHTTRLTERTKRPSP